MPKRDPDSTPNADALNPQPVALIPNSYLPQYVPYHGGPHPGTAPVSVDYSALPGANAATVVSVGDHASSPTYTPAVGEFSYLVSMSYVSMYRPLRMHALQSHLS
jgi:hypothetical protein